MKFHLHLFFFFSFLVNIYSQTFNFLNVPVFEDGDQLTSAWAGGMNAPQWASFDINNDGLKDLYAFDRNGNVHLSFINKDGTPGNIDYEYARYWLANFPDAPHYVMMRDYNRDGAIDMFTSAFTLNMGLSGIKVYKGFFENGLLGFDLVEFPEYEYDIIPFVQNGEIINKIEVYNNGDYSAIDDLDGDGDLDILTMNINGSKVLYYQNVALESGYTDDTLLYELADECWGRFGLTPFSQKLTLSGNQDECAFFRPPGEVGAKGGGIHGGTTLCTFDMDNDGDKEILYGDLIYPTIILGTNGGGPDEAWMVGQDTMFPSSGVSVGIPDFPASFHLDVNNDGAKDLVFSPNLSLGTPDVQTAWLYENTGTGQSPSFSLVKKDLLADEMLDFGTGAHPAFADVNGDGLMDMVVGNRLEWVNTIGDANYFLALMLNTGTATDPVYELVNRDWLNLSDDPTGTRSFSPTFGDIDGDGDEDMIFGDRWGFIHLLENIAGPNMPMDFAPIQYEWKNINVGAYSTPFIFDVNKDGLADLVIGERNGTVNYFPNIGSLGNPDFHPIEEEAPNNFQFGKINTQLGGAIGFSQPVIYSSSDADYLISGTDKGWLMLYKINPDSLDNGSFELVDGQFGGLREGYVSRLSLADINGGDFLEAVIGNDRGGLTLFQSPISVDGLVGTVGVTKNYVNAFTVYPNPASGFIKIKMEDNMMSRMPEYIVFNSMGQRLQGGVLDNDEIVISDLDSGVYYIRINIGEVVSTERFVKF